MQPRLSWLQERSFELCPEDRRVLRTLQGNAVELAKSENFQHVFSPIYWRPSGLDFDNLCHWQLMTIHSVGSAVHANIMRSAYHKCLLYSFYTIIDAFVLIYTLLSRMDLRHNMCFLHTILHIRMGFHAAWNSSDSGLGSVVPLEMFSQVLNPQAGHFDWMWLLIISSLWFFTGHWSVNI